MRRLDRKTCICPATWQSDVQKAFPDHAEYARRAAAFEKLGINDGRRRAGFSAFAAHVLVVKDGKVVFPDIWGKHKEVIAAMSHRKCVYCEAPVTGRRGAHVEHYQPKALFPSRAYVWTNYFLGCPDCNGAKWDKWPKKGGYIRPDRGDPPRHFVFLEDGAVQAVNPNGPAARMIDDFDLNRKWLVDRRKRHIHQMLKLLDLAAGFCRNGHSEQAKSLAGTLLASVGAPDADYSVAVTQCFSRAWKNACLQPQL